MSQSLRSKRYDLTDAFAVNEFYHAKGWTDGLPIVPPTEERVSECLDAAGFAPGDIIGIEQVRQRPIIAEKAAINAVLAGCLPAYMPVVVAVLDAMCDAQYNLHGTSASTGGAAPFIVVNGPVRTLIGMNATHNVLGNGNRANATIGRAIRLVLINVLGVIPGEMDRSTLGHPGKFTFCIAEDEEDSPWVPLAQEREIPEGQSAVTVMAAGAPRQIMNEWTADPEQILETFAAEMRHNMLTYSVWAGNYVLVIPKQLRDLLVAAGWQKRDIREYIFRSARVIRSDWAKIGKANIVDRSGGPMQEFTALKEPSDLLIVAAGGPAGGFGAVIPPWLGSKARAVTKPIDL
ncbi:MAG: hypothetical protein AUI45_07305 [Acidobacteria bacterium 13_1_40CM_2_56_11]|nr:MAG: hypothetical protein AUI45_07305 [Acidobacteria bacterium 13_1_40CM_2_56_11]